jgi:CheY-like chemotaxis protein
MHILVVDDDALAGEMTGSILEDAGFRVTLSDNGLDAMDRLGQADYDLVVSDMNMPMVDGLELFATLREQGNHTPFILVSGDDPATLLAREPALDGCLIKDFSMAETLVKAIHALDRSSDRG